MDHRKNLMKGYQHLSVYQTLTLMLLFGTFLIALLDYINKRK